MQMKTIPKLAIKFLMLAALVFCAMEVRLEMFSPSPFIAKGGKIVLPANKEYVFVNKNAVRLDPVVHVRKNSLGFRGVEPPANFSDHYSVIIVGGSSAACDNLSEGKTWEDRLAEKLRAAVANLWLNNAGFAGHSSIANILLMEDYVVKLKPKMVIFFVGINDINIEGQSQFDNSIVQGRFQFNSAIDFLRSVSRNIETINLLVNLAQRTLGVKRSMAYGEYDLRTIPRMDLPENIVRDRLKKQQESLLPAFDGRIHQLLKLCRDNNIMPVYVTVPALFGDAVDDVTGVNLGTMAVSDNENGHLKGALLEMYNQRILDLRTEHVIVIDLAHELPKSSRYFSDFYHFTNEGAALVADLIHKDLMPVIQNNLAQSPEQQ